MSITDQLAHRAKDIPNLIKDADKDEAPDAVIEAFTLLLEGAHDIDQVDARFVEQNLSDVGTLLDRVFAIRRDIIELEGARVKSALAYISGLDVADADFDLEVAKHPGSASVLEAAKRKLENLRSAIEILEKRHGAPGGALNFVEQRLRLEARLKIELAEAYTRSLAVHRGLSMLDPIWGRVTPIPKVKEEKLWAKFDGATHLDEWLFWYRGAAIWFERLQLGQSIDEGSISLGMIGDYSFIKDGVKQNDRKPIFPNLVASIRNGAPIVFNLGYNVPGWPFELGLGDRAFLRGIGLTISLPDDQSRRWQFSAEVVVPNLPRPILTGIISPFTSTPEWISDSILFNRSPAGMWQVRILANPLLNADANDQARLAPNNWPILDLQLHLRVAML